MTAVKGHLTAVEFPGDYQKWEHPPPDSLFDAPVLTVIPTVSRQSSVNLRGGRISRDLTLSRTINILQRISRTRQNGLPSSSSGRIAIARGNILVVRSGTLRGRAIVKSRSNGPGSAMLRERMLLIWTPCLVFTSLTICSHILSAARRLDSLDEKQVDAVAARIELDLRIGYAFTRFLTLNLRPLGGPLSGLTLSYGRLSLTFIFAPHNIYSHNRRLLSIPYPRLRRRPVLPRQELRPRAFLVHQSDARARRNQG